MTFSLELSDDVIAVRDWVHEFAVDVVRPAAAEWDEREETPWPVIQEAAKCGLYSMEMMATQAAEPTGLGILVVFEEMFWGDAGIGLSIMGTALAAASLCALVGIAPVAAQPAKGQPARSGITGQARQMKAQARRTRTGSALPCQCRAGCTAHGRAVRHARQPQGEGGYDQSQIHALLSAVRRQRPCTQMMREKRARLWSAWM